MEIRLPAGRATKLTPEVLRGIVKLVRQGVPYKYAAEAHDINPATLFEWIKKGKLRKSKPIYREFNNSLKAAKAKGIAARVMRIAKAAKTGVWQADAWWLERQADEEFAVNRREVAELRKQLAEMGEAIAKIAGSQAKGEQASVEAPNPAVGGVGPEQVPAISE